VKEGHNSTVESSHDGNSSIGVVGSEKVDRGREKGEEVKLDDKCSALGEERKGNPLGLPRVCLDKCAVIQVMVNAILLDELILIRCGLEMNGNRYFE